MDRGRLDDKVSVVTGSTSGIGKGIAKHFASLGSKVVVSGRSEQRGSQVVDEIAKAGDAARFRRADLTRVEDCVALMTFAAEAFGRLDVLVNNAATAPRSNVESTTIELWETVMATNLRAPFVCTQEAVKLMKPRGAGSIVNIGSVNAYIGEPKLFAYAVSKGGLMTLTRNSASYLRRYRIRVNGINVGWTLTEGEHRYKAEEGKPPDWVEEAVKTRPFGRLFSPEDVALAAAYFATDQSECVSGTIMDLAQGPVGALGAI